MPASDPVSGWAAGVPYTALAPAREHSDAPLVVVWHMMDEPRSDAGFAAVLPLASLPAWRVYLGLPMVGRRPVEGAFEAAQADPVFRYVDPLLRQAGSEFPAALAELRRQLPIRPGPIGLVGGSLGGTVALDVLARNDVQVAALALINPAVRARAAVEVLGTQLGRPYPWTPEADAAVARFDFLARADRFTALRPRPAVLVVSGEDDHAGFREDAARFTEVLREGRDEPDRVRRTTVPGLAHSLAASVDPVAAVPAARLVDQVIAEWLGAALRPGPAA
jgi:pimeloyl-ACP methyl ester carboxylesterase